MKLFKKLATACLALTFCFGLVAFVACGDDPNAGNSTGAGNSSTSSSVSSDVIVEDSSDVSSDVVVEDSSDVSSDVVVEDSSDVSSDVVVENSSDIVVEDSSDVIVEDSSDVVVEDSSDVVVEDSSDVVIEDSSSADNDNAPVAKANAYNFIIRNADGSPAVGYSIQMCTTDDSGICYAPSIAVGNASDENGFVYLEIGSMSCPTPDVYEVHVMLDGAQVELSAVVNTPAAVSLEFIILTLA